ncbi:MAG: adenylate/guanylate cyclase domain-containing protein [Leptospiraceae bacterium]|nr:adenylate/guanylate cyclase domain-containing protein [Leptospiraceae bacterium]
MNKFFFLALFLLSQFCSQILEFKPSPKAVKGELDLRKAHFENNEVINLDGEWEFYWQQFLISNPTEKQASMFLTVPGVWTGIPKGETILPREGFGTYRLKLFLPEGSSTFALKIQDLSSAYRLYFNGELIAENGFSSILSETFRPQFNPLITYIRKPQLENEMVLEISNYTYPKGGLWESIRIGSIEGIHDFREIKLGFDLFLTGSLLIMGIYHIGLFSLRRKDKSSLYLGNFCFIMIIRLLTTGERLLFTAFPNINWEFGLKLEYLSFYLATPVFSLFLHSLYPDEFKSKVLKWIIAASIVFNVLVLFTYVKFYAMTAIYYQLLTVFALSYGVFALSKGVINKREGALVALMGFIVLFLTIINDILYANSIVNTAQLSPFGLFVFIFSQAFLLSVRFSKAFFSVELLSHDLSKTNVAYSRFVPKEFLSYLEKQNITEVMLGDQIQKDMTILFSDIRSFTEMSESMSPEENFNFINEYLRVMNPIIRKYNGFIDKYIGDAIMALFPLKTEDAVLASIEMIRGLQSFNIIRATQDLPPVKIGIGIHTGSLMLGTVGDSERMEGTVISDAVNLASRIEGLTKIYGASIVVSEKTMMNLPNYENYNYRFLGKVEVKGKKDPAPIFEIFESDEIDIRQKKKDSKMHFELAINAFFNGEKEEARKLFEEIFANNQNDMASFYYMQKCKEAQPLS